MPRGKRRHPDDMNVVFHRLAGCFLGRLEQGTDIDIEAKIGEGTGDDLLAAVMAVLPHFGDKNARPPPVLGLE